MTVSDNTKQVEGHGDFFKILVKKGLNVSKKMAENVSINLARALEIGATLDAAFASQSPKATLSSLNEMVNFIIRLMDYTWANLCGLC